MGTKRKNNRFFVTKILELTTINHVVIKDIIYMERM